jgi:hypothetical protein
MANLKIPDGIGHRRPVHRPRRAAPANPEPNWFPLVAGLRRKGLFPDLPEGGRETLILLPFPALHRSFDLSQDYINNQNCQLIWRGRLKIKLRITKA